MLCCRDRGALCICLPQYEQNSNCDDQRQNRQNQPDFVRQQQLLNERNDEIVRMSIALYALPVTTENISVVT